MHGAGPPRTTLARRPLQAPSPSPRSIVKFSKDAQAAAKERVLLFNRAHNSAKRKGKGAAEEPAAKRPAKSAEKQLDESIGDEIREQLRLPQGMKLRLIEDWERVTRERKLVPLPRDATVGSILTDFLAAKAKHKTQERLYGEVCDGLKSYFNQAIGTVLLYKYERKQFNEMKGAHKDKSPAEIYGAEHLLRLFVKLPDLLGYAKLQREHLTVLVSKLTEMLKFLQTNKAKYFAPQYEAPTADYLAWWSSSE